MTGNDRNAMVAAVMSWWRGLFPAETPRGDQRAGRTLGDPRGNASARARLRRCQSIADALMEPETHALLSRVPGRGEARLDERLALLAMVLPLVAPGPSRGRFARLLGEKASGGNPNREQGERPRLSESRFGALMRALDADDDPDRAVRALRRALPLLGDVHFDVGAFVREILLMSDEIRRRWTCEYWQTDWRPVASEAPEAVLAREE